MDLHDDPALDTTRAPTRQAPEAAQDAKLRADRHDHHLLQLQRLAGNAAVAQLVQDDAELVRRATEGGGATIEPALRQQMETAMGQDFSNVRVHTGGEATKSAQRLGANAYTVGNDIVFAPGRYDPASSSGQRTLAHELTHVVQQRSGPVDGMDMGTGVKVSDPGDRFERAADANADAVMAGRGADEAVGAAPPMIQREMDESAEDEMLG
jgi:hypothetical protein